MSIEGDLLREPSGEGRRQLPRSTAHVVAVASRPSHVGLGARWATHVNGWLLLLPAAVLLVTFTHYPAVATIIDSFFSTPKGRRAAVFVGADNYQALLGDPVFWRAFSNNIVYAASVIPLTIALSLAMALWVNGRIAGRPSMGSWLSYGLGSANQNLPTFCVLISQKRPDQPLYSRLWGNGFLPSVHQGVQFRAGADPVLYLENPPGVSAAGYFAQPNTYIEMPTLKVVLPVGSLALFAEGGIGVGQIAAAGAAPAWMAAGGFALHPGPSLILGLEVGYEALLGTDFALILLGPIVSVRHSRNQSRRSCGSSSRAARVCLSLW